MDEMSTIVMTGGTSGFGKVGAQLMTANPDVRLIVGTRGRDLKGAKSVPLELASLKSVRAFVRQTVTLLTTTPIDALVLNASTSCPDNAQRTQDGYERMFAVNHLAHYLILRLLSPHLRTGARVIITTSDTHDSEHNRLAAPTFVVSRRLAYPELERGGPQHPFIRGLRAYATSKLCNLLTARAFAAMPETQTRRIRLTAYNPGRLAGYRTARSPPLRSRLAMSVRGALRGLGRGRASGVAAEALAGEVLAGLALGEVLAPEGRLYASLIENQVTWPDPSHLARRDDLVRALWEESEMLVGYAAMPTALPTRRGAAKVAASFINGSPDGVGCPSICA